MMDTILKTIIGPIVIGFVLRLVDKWLSVKKTLCNLNKSNGNLNLTNEATTDLFLSHIHYKSPCQFPDQNPKNIGKLFLG